MPVPNGTATRRSTPPVAPPTPAELRTEYVAGGSYGYVAQYARALPIHIDDVSADFGSDIYERMALDPQIAACLAVIKASILEDGVDLNPAIEDASEDGYDLAVQIQDEADRMLDDLSTSLDDVLWNLLDSLPQGNKIAEQVFELRAGTTTGSQLLQLSSLKVKPRHSYLFVVDAFQNTVGILGRRPGEAAPSVGSWYLDTRQPPDNMLSTQKFAISTFRPKDGDPRGTSVLRPAYDAWWRKRQALLEYVKYLAQFAGPSIWATTPPDAQAQAPLDFLGNTVPYAAPLLNDPLGNPEPVPFAQLTPEQQLMGMLQQFRNGTVAAFPAGTDLHTIVMQGEGRAFLQAIAECNMSITKAILTQELATEQGEHQARAAAQVHQDVLDTLVRQGKRSVVRMLQKQILKLWVAYNWGDKAAGALVPKVSLGATEERDIAPMMTAVAQLQKSGYLHESQLPEIDTILGLPVRDLTQDPVIDEAGDGSGPSASPATGQGPSGEPSAPDGPAQPSTKPQSTPAQQQPAQEQEPPPPPNKVKVRPHLRGKPQRRPRALRSNRVYA